MTAPKKLRNLLAAALAVAAIGCDGRQGSPSALTLTSETRPATPDSSKGLPALTGRVVDQADLISPTLQAQLDRLSAELERKTTDQLVIVTLNSLDGRSIEDTGVALGRAWGIGQKNKDNAVLLVVAPNERRVRIEVGYGLERSLTDERAAEIIDRDLLPSFRKGEFEQGIRAGAEAISQLLVSHAAAQRVGAVK